MTVTATTSVTYPAPRTPIQVSFGTTASGANFVRLACTGAPTGSKEKAKLDANASSEVVVFEGDSTSQWRFNPGAAGRYVFTAYEIQKGAAAYGGGYQDAPDTYQSESILASNSLSIYVGDWVTTQLGTAPDTATLRLLVVNDTIRQTTLTTHEEATPAIVGARTPLADSAATSATMTDAIAALVDVAASTALGNPGAVLQNIMTQYAAHRASAAYHYSADTDNAISTAYSNPTSPGGIASSATESARLMSRHIRNDDGTGVGSQSWHQSGGQTAADMANSFILNSASSADRRSQLSLIADLWRVYESHRVTSVHQASDTANACTALPAILEIHRKFLAAIAAASPDTPTGANPGTTTLVFSGGFTSDG